MIIHHTIKWYIIWTGLVTVAVDLDHFGWDRVCQVSSLWSCSLAIPSFSLWKEVNMYSSQFTLRTGNYAPFLVDGVSPHIIWNFSAWEIGFCFSINLFFQKCIHLRKDSWYVFCILGYIPLLLYHVAQIIPAQAMGSSFSWPLFPFNIAPYEVVFFASIS